MDTVKADLRKFKLADLIFLYFWVAIPGFLSLDKIFNQLVSFVKNYTLFTPKRSDLYTLS